MKLFYAAVAMLLSFVCNAQGIAFETLPQGKEPGAVKRSIAKLLKAYEVSPKQARFKTLMIDLDNDGRKDALVLFDDMNFCGGSGAGGCTLFAFRCSPSKCNSWFNISIVNPPFYISSERTKGLPHFVAAVAGAPNADKFAILKFDGKTYPISPADGEMTTEGEMKKQKLVRLF